MAASTGSMTLETYYSHFVDVAEDDVKKSRDIVTSVLEVIFSTIEKRFLGGVKREPMFGPCIWQGSSVDGLKAVAADECDVLLPLLLEEHNYLFVPESVEPTRSEVETKPKENSWTTYTKVNMIFGSHFELLIKKGGDSSSHTRLLKKGKEKIDFILDWESGSYEWRDKIQEYRSQQNGLVLSSAFIVQQWLSRMVEGAIEYNSDQISKLVPGVSKVVMKKTSGRGPNLNLAIFLTKMPFPTIIDVDLVPAIPVKMSRSSFMKDGLPDAASSPFKFSSSEEENQNILEKGWLLGKDKPFQHAWMLATTLLEKEKLCEIKEIFGDIPFKCIKILKTLKLFYHAMTSLYPDENPNFDGIDLMFKDGDNFVEYPYVEMEMKTLYSYSIKMCMFHLINKIPSPAEWGPDKLNDRLRDLMIEVKAAHEKGELMNYFCSSVNVLAKTQQYEQVCEENNQLLLHYTRACNEFAKKFGMQVPFDSNL